MEKGPNVHHPWNIKSNLSKLRLRNLKLKMPKTKRQIEKYFNSNNNIKYIYIQEKIVFVTAKFYPLKYKNLSCLYTHVLFANKKVITKEKNIMCIKYTLLIDKEAI